jgi:hypothetical protein
MEGLGVKVGVALGVRVAVAVKVAVGGSVADALGSGVRLAVSLEVGLAPTSAGGQSEAGAQPVRMIAVMVSRSIPPRARLEGMGWILLEKPWTQDAAKRSVVRFHRGFTQWGILQSPRLRARDRFAALVKAVFRRLPF